MQLNDEQLSEPPTSIALPCEEEPVIELYQVDLTYDGSYCESVHPLDAQLLSILFSSSQ
jgi:hypothetical protein